MVVKVLSENTAISDEFLSEHGLSLYIETDKHKLLFDTGQSDLFYQNAQKMGADLSKVDIVVISHGHYDHGGGIETFLKHNSIAKLYINKNAFGEFYNGQGKYIGLNQALKQNDRIILVDDEYKIDDELFLFSANNKERPYETQSVNLYEDINQKRQIDKYLHEQYLYIAESSKKVLISGCSHKGILNVMSFVNNLNIDVLIGGFHFKDIKLDNSGKKVLDFIALKLLQYKTKYFTCHCTGVKQYEYVKPQMKDKIDYLSTGMTVSI